MSMLTAQIDSLRLMARLVREYDYKEISRMLREAADTIESLREKLQSWTCRIEGSYLNDFTGPLEYWYEFEMECGYEFRWDEKEPLNYCPNCGRKVVSE